MQAVGAGERRLVARLGALALHRLQQRGLLAADVAAGADEGLELEGAAGAEDVGRRAARRPRRRDLVLDDLDLRLVLVADVDDAGRAPVDQAGEQHALHQQVRHVREEEAVLEGAGLALVGVADDVLGRRPACCARSPT